MKNEIAILDFGSQYTHLIARRVRELGVISHIYPNDVSATKLKNAYGIILSGGPRSVAREPKLTFDQKIFDLKIPILGLCYGHQLMADFFGGQVESGKAREYGLARMQALNSPIFANLNKLTNVWMSHGDHVSKLPNGFKQIAKTGENFIAAMANEKRKFYGLQFHPEVKHTEMGKIILFNFVFNICGAKQNWTTDKLLRLIKKQIIVEAGNKKIFMLLSGGVDSTVAFALLEKTLGKNRIFGLHIDHGLMRHNESKMIATALKKIGIANLHIYNAEKEYLKALKNIVDPEQKRKIIGDLFLDIANKVMSSKKMLGNKWLLGQGTIYPDTIESGGTKNADLIKTHHNRVARVRDMMVEGKIIEPIKELYKDEVRAIGLKLGLPDELIFRHPFPGPGLGIRCLGSEKNNEKPKFLANTTWDGKNKRWLFQFSNSNKNNKNVEIYQLPVKSVGVQGDERSYAHPALINNVNFTNANWQNLHHLAPLITNQYKEVNRVLFLAAGDKEKIITSKLKPAYVNRSRLNLLRQIDAIVNRYVINNPACAHIWQLPVVLIPFGYNKGESIVLRPVESEEAMTVAFAQLPKELGEKMLAEIMALKKIDFIFYDITNKPPGTIEWE